MSYEINFWVEFVSGCDQESLHPGQDKLWLSVYLDERDDWGLGTVDCECIELPLSFLNLDRAEREAVIASHMDEAIQKAAAMLERFKQKGWDVEGYTVNPDAHVMEVVFY